MSEKQSEETASSNAVGWPYEENRSYQKRATYHSQHEMSTEVFHQCR